MKSQEYIRKYNLSEGVKFNHQEFVMDFAFDFQSLIEFYQAKSSEFSYSIFQQIIKQIRQKWDGVSNKTAGELPETLWNYFWATVVVKEKEFLFPDIINKEHEINFMTMKSLVEFINGFEVFRIPSFSYSTISDFVKPKDEWYDKVENSQIHLLQYAFNVYCNKYYKRESEQKEKERRKWEQRQKEREQWNNNHQNDSWDWFNYIFGGKFKLNLKPIASFSVLGLSADVGIDEIKSVYRQLALKHHPDKGGSHEKFIEITDAKNKCLAYLQNV